MTPRASRARRILPLLLCLAAGIVIGMEAGPVASLFRCRTREVSFAGPGHHALVGKIYYPPWRFGGRYPSILFCHGLLPRGKDTPLYVYLMRRLARKGYLVLSFDLCGFGESAKTANYRIPRDCDFLGETKAALSYMLRELPVDRERLAVAGHSMGANLALAAGARDDRVRRIIVISAGDFKGASPGEGAGKTFLCRRFERIVKSDVPAGEWARITAPLPLSPYLPLPEGKRVLVVVADDDAANIVEYNRRFYDRLSVPKAFVTIPDSDHNFGFDMAAAEEMVDPSAAVRLARAMHKWMSRP